MYHYVTRCTILVSMAMAAANVLIGDNPPHKEAQDGLSVGIDRRGPVTQFLSAYAEKLQEIGMKFGKETAGKTFMALACAEGPVSCLEAIKVIKGSELEIARQTGTTREIILSSAYDALDQFKELLESGALGFSDLLPDWPELIEAAGAGFDFFLDVSDDVEARLQAAEKAALDGRRLQREVEARAKLIEAKPPTKDATLRRNSKTGASSLSGTPDWAEFDKAILFLDWLDRGNASFTLPDQKEQFYQMFPELRPYENAAELPQTTLGTDSQADLARILEDARSNQDSTVPAALPSAHPVSASDPPAPQGGWHKALPGENQMKENPCPVSADIAACSSVKGPVNQIVCWAEHARACNEIHAIR